MTVDVKIKLNPSQVMPDIFDWLHAQGWQHIVDWRWFRPKDNSGTYIFQFEEDEHAILFSLKWM
jgi:hypothetical protein